MLHYLACWSLILLSTHQGSSFSYYYLAQAGYEPWAKDGKLSLTRKAQVTEALITTSENIQSSKKYTKALLILILRAVLTHYELGLLEPGSLGHSGEVNLLCWIKSMKFNCYTLKNNDGSALAECCKESLLKTIWNKNKAT